MMLTTHQAAHLIGAQTSGADLPFLRVVTDTRLVQAGDLFVALKGDRALILRYVPHERIPLADSALVEVAVSPLTFTGARAISSFQSSPYCERPCSMPICSQPSNRARAAFLGLLQRKSPWLGNLPPQMISTPGKELFIMRSFGGG